MRNYILFLNGQAINDFYTFGRALNAYERRLNNSDRGDIVELIELKTGNTIASSL